MNPTNTNLTFQGNKLNVTGNELKVGSPFPQFKLTGTDMKDITNDSIKGKVAVISIIPSIDTSTCQLQTKRFNKEATEFTKDVVVLTVSEDLPFAQKRWCGAEGVDKVTTASDYKYRTFGASTGTWMPDMGLLARAVVVVDKSGIIQYVDYVPVLSDEPDYASALKKVREIL